MQRLFPRRAAFIGATSAAFTGAILAISIFAIIALAAMMILQISNSRPGLASAKEPVACGGLASPILIGGRS